MSRSDKSSYEDMLKCSKLLPLYPKFTSLPDLKEITQTNSCIFISVFLIELVKIRAFNIWNTPHANWSQNSQKWQGGDIYSFRVELERWKSWNSKISFYIKMFKKLFGEQHLIHGWGALLAPEHCLVTPEQKECYWLIKPLNVICFLFLCFV